MPAVDTRRINFLTSGTLPGARDIGIYVADPKTRNSQLLYNEPKYIRLDDGGLHTLESNGLILKEGVYY